ncbi:DUF3021 family protein [Aerococcus suis]|uniref:DUF3021 family protein n=1 Tax=Aerococcus suis TaxID=371602 RepID=UPI00135637DD|nr:DUF3021 family protein [Aerococcus suis]MCI7240244.1 DUF3021 family protein [Aerococcus suis]MDY4646032.1 DUF3021 family protein [Aerococcus suis]
MFLVIAKYNQWLPMTFEATFWFFVVFIFIFFLIWQFYFIYHRYLVHKINRKISQN